MARLSDAPRPAWELRRKAAITGLCPHKARWDDDRNARLRQLIAEGVKTNDIAARFGTNRKFIVRKCRELGLALPGSHGDKAARIAASTEAKRAKAKEKARIRALAATRDATSWRKPVHLPAPAVVATTRSFVDPQAFNGTGTHLLEAGPYACRWPLGDGRRANHTCCGARVVADRSYCADHMRVAYLRPRLQGEAEGE